MQEIKIPEGCKASIDFEKRVVVIEKDGSKFKSGDIIISDYFIIPDMGINYYFDTVDRIFKVYSKIEVGCVHITEHRDASPSEHQLLFDALAKEGKRWNSTTLQIEDIEKDILVPESIGIYRCKEYFGTDGDGLYVGFNDRTQILYYNSKYNAWGVSPLHSGYERVQCKLTPCKREDLRLGDTVAIVNEHLKIEEVLSDIDLYNKAVGDREYASVEYGRNIQVYDEKISPKLSEHLFYKVEPINK